MSIITLNNVKSTVGLAATVEERKLQPFYSSAERTLKRILGDTLFARIEAAASTPGSDVPADDLIANLVGPFLSWFTYHRALPVLYAEPDRNGIHYKNDSNTIQSDTGHLKHLMKVAADMADQYQQDIITTMEESSGAGDEWEDYATNPTGLNRSARKTYAGIVTKRSRWQNPPDMRWGNTRYYRGYNDCHECE